MKYIPSERIDVKNERIRQALERSELTIIEIAARVGLPVSSTYDRVYRLRTAGIIGSAGDHKWRLLEAQPEPIAEPHAKVAPRTAPDWRTSTLTGYDLDAHRRLAMVTR